MFRSVSRTPVLEVHTWRMLMVPYQVLGGWGPPWHHVSSWYVILYLCAKFQLSSMIISGSRTLSLKSILGGLGGVPDWRLGGWGHIWLHRSSWKIKIKLSWKFCKDRTSFGWDIELFGLIETDRQTDTHTDRHTDRLTWSLLEMLSHLKIHVVMNWKFSGDEFWCK